jgi:cytochrome c
MRAVITLIVVLVVGWTLGTAWFNYDHHRSTERNAAAITRGDPDRGHKLITQYGCAACHTIPGFHGTKAQVGPPLTGIGGRMYIAGGAAENKPDQLIAFLRDPRGVNTHGAMPNLHVTEADARDLAAFLYTLE